MGPDAVRGRDRAGATTAYLTQSHRTRDAGHAMGSWWELGERQVYSGGTPDWGGLRCPHCLYRGSWEIAAQEVVENQSLGKRLHFDLVRCCECRLLSLVMWSSARRNAAMHGVEMFPPSLRESLKAPSTWPQQVGRPWEQAHKALDTESWDAAAAMGGKALEAAARHLGAKASTLAKMIDELGSAGMLPQAMVDWAHEIRLLRNVGAHAAESEVEAQDAQDMVEFLDLFLHYALTLPEEISAYKARRGNVGAG